MGGCDRLYDRQAESCSSRGSGTRRVSTPERIDCYFARVFRKAGAAIMDMDRDKAVGNQFRLASQYSTACGITTGIFQKREHGLPDALAIGDGLHCDGKIPNCLPVVEGWNYTVRLYRPDQSVVSGEWKFPEAKPRLN